MYTPHTREEKAAAFEELQHAIDVLEEVTKVAHTPEDSELAASMRDWLDYELRHARLGWINNSDYALRMARAVGVLNTIDEEAASTPGTGE